MSIVRVVLTGGPCAGKTSALRRLTARFAGEYAVFCVPEVPTLLLAGGCTYPGTAPDKERQLMAFEQSVIATQLALEDAFLNVARAEPRRAIVFFDRGLLDIKAYLDEPLWRRLTPDSDADYLDRYDAVLHLVTAADGAEEAYTLGNNKARTETVEQAKALDNAVLESWGSHSNRSVIDNGPGGFDRKVERVIAAVEGLL